MNSIGVGMRLVGQCIHRLNKKNSGGESTGQKSDSDEKLVGPQKINEKGTRYLLRRENGAASAIQKEGSQEYIYSFLNRVLRMHCACHRDTATHTQKEDARARKCFVNKIKIKNVSEIMETSRKKRLRNPARSNESLK